MRGQNLPMLGMPEERARVKELQRNVKHARAKLADAGNAGLNNCHAEVEAARPARRSPPPQGLPQPYLASPGPSLKPLPNLPHVDLKRFATVMHEFNGSERGLEYVSFARRARIMYIPAPPIEDDGWHYGQVMDTAAIG